MKVRFNIEYSTIYGENLVLNIVDNATPDKVTGHVMKPATDKSWKPRVDGDSPSSGPLCRQSQPLCHL